MAASRWRRFRLHLTPFFQGRRLSSITTSDVRKFVAVRQGAGASNGEINREVTSLKRMFTLAVQAGKLLHKPYIPMLKEDNVRTGFFERNQLEGVLRHLPPPVACVIEFAYVTGWRVPSEVLTLEWRQVDFEAGEIRLDPGRTKNGEGRVFPMTASLRALLDERRLDANTLARERGRLIPYVFHYPTGEPIRAFRRQWAKACAQACLPGRLVHDLRRTAVRNLVRAGVPERVAMTMTGHKTRSVFERYNIVSEGDLKLAAKQLDAARGDNSGDNRSIRQVTAS